MEHFPMEGVSPVTAAKTDAMSDRELVARCQAGDEAAFDKLVCRHQQRALNVAFQLLRDHEDAMEVAQDAFVRVYRSIGEFRGDSEFTTWLHQIVVNLARNKRRWWTRRGREKAVSLDSGLTTMDGDVKLQVAAADDPPDVAVVKKEFVQAVGEHLAQLPGKFREVLVLRNIEDMSYEEIAAALHCSVGTVKSRIARAREALRQGMHDESAYAKASSFAGATADKTADKG
jgi:RNA polymerase sigma-70 factor (ECF subfamily)